MIKHENQCVDCGLPCIREACRYYDAKVYICDNCKCEDETLYYYDDEQLCIECIKKRLEEVI